MLGKVKRCHPSCDNIKGIIYFTVLAFIFLRATDLTLLSNEYVFLLIEKLLHVNFTLTFTSM